MVRFVPVTLSCRTDENRGRPGTAAGNISIRRGCRGTALFCVVLFLFRFATTKYTVRDSSNRAVRGMPATGQNCI